MKDKNKLFVVAIIFVFAQVGFAHTMVKDCPEYSVKLDLFGLDKKTHETWHYSSAVHTVCKGDAAEFVIDIFPIPETTQRASSIGTGKGSFLKDIEMNLDRHYKNLNIPIENINLKKWHVLVKKIFDDNHNQPQTMFSIEVQTLKGSNSKGTKYSINSDVYILTEDELRNSREFSYIDENNYFDTEMGKPDPTRMITFINENKIEYVTVEVSELIEPKETKRPEIIELSPSNKMALDIPILFDIKFDDKEGRKTFLSDVHPAKPFKIEMLKQKLHNEDSTATNLVSFDLTGKLFPFQYENDILSVELVLQAQVGSFEKNYLTSIYRKNLSFNKNDVIEISLPEFWSVLNGEDRNLIKQLRITNENQSLFIKLKNVVN